MRREKPHIVHTHTATAGLLGRLAARLAGVPVIVHTFHGHVLRGYFGPILSKVLVWMERFLARLSDRIVTVSEGQRRELAGYGIAPLEKITVVPLGFELEELLACESQRGELRRELDLANENKLVGIVARLVPIKNHRLFLQAAQVVAEAVPQARFLVVGDGELREELEAYSRDLGLDGRVVFTGWRRDLPRLYADLDVVALTSINEGTPVSPHRGHGRGSAGGGHSGGRRPRRGRCGRDRLSGGGRGCRGAGLGHHRAAQGAGKSEGDGKCWP